MPKSKRSETEPLTGEILPPACVATTSVAEMGPAEFLSLHGIKSPKPKAYRTFEGAMRAITTEVAEGKP
jgi:hypothetical protein